ncbi:MAG: hypothetical protein PHE02_06615 [Lachnospiraceae bacterium]|nr:hypothetical protein [Lachnospiraceae bacterium]
MNYHYTNKLAQIQPTATILAKAKISTSRNMKNQSTESTASEIISSIQNGSRDSDAGKTEKLQKILNKFRSGKKLTAEELEYLRQYAPEMYQKVIQIQQQREAIEQEMKSARTKEEAEQVLSQVTTMISGQKGDEFTQEAMSSQLTDAVKEGMEGKQYRDDEELNRQKEQIKASATGNYNADGNEQFKDLPQKRNGKNLDMVV